MKTFPQLPKKTLKKIITIALAVLCLISLIFFIVTVHRLFKSNELAIDYHLKDRPIRMSQNLATSSIKIWMTFDYLNVIFQLPKNYLQDVLDIDDSRYPNTRIDHYIRRHNLNPHEFIEKIEKSITNYSRLE